MSKPSITIGDQNNVSQELKEVYARFNEACKDPEFLAYLQEEQDKEDSQNGKDEE